jgi:serine/threonine-protein kinase
MPADMFGPYRLEEMIGRGGMGEVWRAFDTVKKRTVALKRLPPVLAADGEFQARFRREAELAAALSEPHIIPIHDYGAIGGQLFIDMRLVDGNDLATILAEHGPLPPMRAVNIIGQVAAALDAAHAAGLIHRSQTLEHAAQRHRSRIRLPHRLRYRP